MEGSIRKRAVRTVGLARSLMAAQGEGPHTVLPLKKAGRSQRLRNPKEVNLPLVISAIGEKRYQLLKKRFRMHPQHQSKDLRRVSSLSQAE